MATFGRLAALYEKTMAMPVKHSELQGIQRSILEGLLRMETPLKAQAYADNTAL